MKHLLLFFTGLILFLTPFKILAQAPPFTVAADTIFFTINGVGSINDNITNTSASGGLGLRWHVVDCDFPADWRSGGAFGICDNNTCWYNIGDTALWNGTTGPNHGSAPYLYNVSGLFDLTLNFPSVAVGTHYVVVAITDVAASYTKNIVFVVTKAPTAVPNVNNGSGNVVLYPNPASNELNLVYDGIPDIKNIAVYNIIGRMMNVYKVSGNSANLNIENIPAGIYFVKLYNSTGSSITKKFIVTK